MQRCDRAVGHASEGGKFSPRYRWSHQRGFIRRANTGPTVFLRRLGHVSSQYVVVIRLVIAVPGMAFRRMPRSRFSDIFLLRAYVVLISRAGAIGP